MKCLWVLLYHILVLKIMFQSFSQLILKSPCNSSVSGDHQGNTKSHNTHDSAVRAGNVGPGTGTCSWH